MHIGFDGGVDMGSPSDLWLIAGGLAFCNIICALSYCANDFLYDHGLVHNISRKGALILYRVLAAFIVIVTVGVLVFWASQAMAAMA